MAICRVCDEAVHPRCQVNHECTHIPGLFSKGCSRRFHERNRQAGRVNHLGNDWRSRIASAARPSAAAFATRYTNVPENAYRERLSSLDPYGDCGSLDYCAGCGSTACFQGVKPCILQDRPWLADRLRSGLMERLTDEALVTQSAFRTGDLARIREMFDEELESRTARIAPYLPRREEALQTCDDLFSFWSVKGVVPRTMLSAAETMTMQHALHCFELGSIEGLRLARLFAASS